MSSLSLREKTVVLVGSMTPMMQSLTIGLTHLGADVGLVNSDIDSSRRFAAQIMDAREINSAYGRSFAIQTDFKKESEIKEAISRVAETFGGIDTYIDTRSSFNLSWGLGDSDEVFKEAEIAQSKKMVTGEVLPFLKGRKKGRVIYLAQKPIFDEELNSPDFQQAEEELLTSVKSLGKELASFNVCINIASVALTEEYLLFHYKGLPIQEALEKLHLKHPGLMITEFDRVTNAVSFLTSAMSTGITGQRLEIT